MKSTGSDSSRIVIRKLAHPGQGSSVIFQQRSNSVANSSNPSTKTEYTFFCLLTYLKCQNIIVAPFVNRGLIHREQAGPNLHVVDIDDMATHFKGLFPQDGHLIYNVTYQLIWTRRLPTYLLVVVTDVISKGRAHLYTLFILNYT